MRFSRIPFARRSGHEAGQNIATLATGLVAWIAAAAIARAQPAPFFSPVGPAGWSAVSSADRVSPSGEWILGTRAAGTFAWERATGARFDLATPASTTALSPASVNESLALVAANGPLQMFLFDGAAWVGIGSSLGAGFTNMRFIGLSEDARVLGFTGRTARTFPASIALTSAGLFDLGAVVEAQLGVTFRSDVITDVATGRPTTIGQGVIAGNVVVPYLFDHTTGVAARLPAPGGRSVFPMAVSHDGLAVTGLTVDSQGRIEAFHWTRRGSPLNGPYTGPFTLCGTLDPSNPFSIGMALDARGSTIVGESIDPSGGISGFAWYEPVPGLTGGINDLFSELTVRFGLAAGPFTGINRAIDMSPSGVMGGDARTTAQTAEAFAARMPPHLCRADITTPFTVLDVADLLRFLVEFNNGEVQADYDFDGVLTAADAQAFGNDVAMGCQ